ncbi:hypothetical protein SprV_0401568700 [Sparganum proliferum]
MYLVSSFIRTLLPPVPDMRLRGRDLSMDGTRHRVLPAREAERHSPSKTLSRRHSVTSPISKRLRSHTGNPKVDDHAAKPWRASYYEPYCTSKYSSETSSDLLCDLLSTFSIYRLFVRLTSTAGQRYKEVFYFQPQELLERHSRRDLVFAALDWNVRVVPTDSSNGHLVGRIGLVS